MKKKIFFRALLLAVLCSCLSPLELGRAADQQLVVDLSANTGPITYGATGFLYGLSYDGIPSDNMLAALKPQVIAQKAPDGLQHPDGDALLVAPQFKRTGGKKIMIYMQDVYADWPYENLGMEDYLAKTEVTVGKVLKDPHRDMYIYIPFNEPDGIWYRSKEKFQKFCDDWKLVYEKIRSLDATGPIAGPNCSYYDKEFYSQFMIFAQQNNVVPDVMTWHELRTDSFTGWYDHYDHYRKLETDLGITPRPIIINEYGRITGDLAIPGRLIQWVSRFENSKVQGCLAYWTSSGALNDLVTQNNGATGGWWLYKWYGDMTGNTVTVTPPNANAQGLQGVATVDNKKKQARVIFGGVSGSTDVVVDACASAFPAGGKIHAVVWEVNSTKLNSSQGPSIVQEGDYTITQDQVIIPVTNMKNTSAYQVILTPATSLAASHVNRYEAEYADLAGTATVSYGYAGYSGTGVVDGYGNSRDAATNFVVSAPKDGYYNVTLGYAAGPIDNAPAQRTTQLMLNGSLLQDVELPGTVDWNTGATKTLKIFLNAGINRIGVNAVTGDNSSAITVDYLDVSPGVGVVDSYEAEAPTNTLRGKAVISNDPEKSGLKYVGFIGAGSNTLQFNDIHVPTAGMYRMIITYANAEMAKMSAGTAEYNSNPVHRYAEISVNGKDAKKVYFRNTNSWENYGTTEVDVELKAGNNTILFGNASSGYAPNIDKIQIAAPYFN